MAATLSVTISGQRADHLAAVAGEYRECLAFETTARAEVEVVQELYRQVVYAASRQLAAESAELHPGLLYNGGHGRPTDTVAYGHYSLRLNL